MLELDVFEIETRDVVVCEDTRSRVNRIALGAVNAGWQKYGGEVFAQDVRPRFGPSPSSLETPLPSVTIRCHRNPFATALSTLE